MRTVDGDRSAKVVALCAYVLLVCVCVTVMLRCCVHAQVFGNLPEHAVSYNDQGVEFAGTVRACSMEATDDYVAWMEFQKVTTVCARACVCARVCRHTG